MFRFDGGGWQILRPFAGAQGDTRLDVMLSGAKHLGGQLRQAEIQNLRLAASRHKKVRGLDIAMDDALRLCRLQCIRDLNGEIQELLRWQGRGTRRSYPQAVLKRLALQKLHDDEGLTFVLSNLVNRADIGVIECRGSLRFTLEPFQGLSVLGEFFRQEFQGDGALELGVLGLIDHTHAPAAQLLQDAVVGEGLTNHRGLPILG